MDEMHISGGFLNFIVESLLKRWIKKNVGIEPLMALKAFRLDLNGDDYSIEMKMNGKITETERKKLATYFMTKKRSGA